MNIIIISAMTVTVKVAKREDEMLADMNRRLKELEQNKTEVK